MVPRQTIRCRRAMRKKHDALSAKKIATSKEVTRSRKEVMYHGAAGVRHREASINPPAHYTGGGCAKNPTERPRLGTAQTTRVASGAFYIPKKWSEKLKKSALLDQRRKAPSLRLISLGKRAERGLGPRRGNILCGVVGKRRCPSRCSEKEIRAQAAIKGNEAPR